MSDPFQDQHRAAQRKAEAEEAAKQVLSRDQRIVAAKTKRERPKFDPPYPYPKGFWR